MKNNMSKGSYWKKFHSNQITIERKLIYDDDDDFKNL